jgi:uncharacterized protein YggE
MMRRPGVDPRGTAQLFVALSLMALVAAPATAQINLPVPPVPQIVTQGRAEVEVVPDRGEVVVQVETRAQAGGAAAEQNAQITRAVLDTLRRGFGLTDRDIGTLGYSLRPQYVYPGDGRPPSVVGFVANNLVRVRTRDLSRIGPIIDAAIRKGATGVSNISFSASGEADIRRAALSQAVANARRDAEAMATAAGGSLGDLIELTNESVQYFRQSPQPMVMMEARAAVADTPIQAGEQSISASVTARWRFVPRR